MGNPFDYQGPVSPARLIDRRDELDGLQRAAASSVAVRLAAPRRFGKTSLLDAHVAVMRSAGHRAVRVDLSKVATVADVAARVAAAYAGLGGDPRRSLRRWSSRLGLQLGTPGLGLTLAPAPPALGAEDARAALLDLLDVPRALHDAQGGLTVVCLDEFQDLLVADDRLDGLFRSVLQHHAGAAAYVYAGSQPSLMRALFAERERPLYGQARPLTLPVLPPEEAAADLDALLRGEGVDPGDAVERILAFTGGHPQRTMLLAHHLFDLLDAGGAPDDPAAAALDRALAETRDAHQAVWDGIGRAERIVLVALADGAAPTGTRVAEEHRLPRSTLQGALERLVRDEQHVVRDPSGSGPARPRLLDPLLGEWLRRR
jgi:hypothetical protein